MMGLGGILRVPRLVDVEWAPSLFLMVNSQIFSISQKVLLLVRLAYH
jgi:hypothetical protein